MAFDNVFEVHVHCVFFWQIQFVSSWPHAVRTVPSNHQPPSFGKPVRIRRTQSPAIQARHELENMADVHTWHNPNWCEYNFVEELRKIYMLQDFCITVIKKAGRLNMYSNHIFSFFITCFICNLKWNKRWQKSSLLYYW